MKTKTKIREGWNEVTINQLVEEMKNGFASGIRDKNGIVQIRMNNVTTDGKLIFNSYLKVPRNEKIDSFILQEGDFLFNNTNSIDLVGKSTIFYEAPFECTFSNHFTRIRFNKNLVLPEIILYHSLLLWSRGFFKSLAIRHVGQAAVSPALFLRKKILLPPISEQKSIIQIISTIDSSIEIIERERNWQQSVSGEASW